MPYEASSDAIRAADDVITRAELAVTEGQQPCADVYQLPLNEGFIIAA